MKSEMDSVLTNRPLVRCEPQYGAIICLTCNNGFPKKGIARHLGGHHIPVNVYGPTVESLQEETLAKDWSNLSRPINESAPIEGLRVRPGFVCMKCGYQTTSPQVIKRHSKCGQMV